MQIIIKDLEILNNAYSVIKSKSDELDGSEDVRTLKNLSKINIFVGENNSGKSHLLRSIIKSKLKFRPHNTDFYKINNNIEQLKIKINNFFKLADFNNNTIPGWDILDEITKKEFLEEDEDYMSPIIGLTRLYNGLKGDRSSPGYYRIPDMRSVATASKTITYDEIGLHLIEIIENTFNLDKPVKDVNLNYDFTKIYIPILRGVRPLNYGESDSAHDDPSFRKDIYGIRTREDYFKDLEDIHIISGLETYDIIHDFLNGEKWQRDMIKKLKEILAVFFSVDKVEIISNPKNNGIITVKIGEEIEKPIFDLGDGIQSIIIILLSLLRYKISNDNGNALVFVEEPEQLLHPGFQRKLIDILFTYEEFNNIQFFFTTHSNHFLDVTLEFEDVSIFTIKKELDDTDDDEKEANFLIEDLSYGNTNALELLGVRNSSVFLSNCTIWVEGITDRYYIKKYLEVFQNHLKEKYTDFIEFREDYHYSFVEYAGSNITHWSFLEGLNEEEKINVKRLCSNVFLISDKDKDDEKLERKKILRENLGNNFCLLTCKEIENLLTEDVLLKVLKDFETRNKEEMDKLDSKNFVRHNFKDEPLGRYIENVLLKDLTRTRKYAADSGTLDSNIKLDFCKKAVNHINEIRDFSEDANGICNCIYCFIAKENGFIDLCEKMDIPKCNTNHTGCQKVEEND